MVSNKHISKIIIAIMAVAVILCFLAMMFSGELTKLLGGTSVRMEYESKLFDTDEIISIDIQMDEDEWNKMLSNAMSEEYYVCDVVINGKKLKSVAIRPKGNTSLSAIAMDPDTNRYSLKLEFDHFVDGQTCYGLDKLILNNNYADATNMKEAIIYDMYQYLDADASLYNYASVSVNGEYWGVYLALEGVEESFMLRNYGTQDGELYKPDSMEMGGGDEDSKSGFSKPDSSFSKPDGGFSKPDGSFSRPDAGSSDSNFGSSDFDFGSSGFDFSGFGGMTPPSGGDNMPGGKGDFSFDPNNIPGGGGANLNYTNDDLDSYSTIWEGEITGTGTADHRRVVTALKNISEGNDPEKYLDVDNVLKYMAVHTFAVNMDSLSGSMAHNYYLYEYNGQLNLFPWDYNLSFGGMNMGSSGDATEMVNDAIDTPFSGTNFFNVLLENEEYLEKYHDYLRQLVEEYVYGGRFDEVYSYFRNKIDSLVETDPTAFYTYDEYLTAADMLYQTIKLRAESIEGQLNGTIPSTDAGQRQDSSALVDASMIDVTAMGQFSMGMSFSAGSSEADSSEASTSENDPEAEVVSGSQSSSGSSQGFSQEFSQGFSQEFKPDNLPDGFDQSSMPDMGNFSFENMPDMGNFSFENMPDMGGFEGKPDMGNFNFENMPGQSSGQTKTKKIIIYGICLIGSVVTTIIISRIRRRK